MKVAHNREIMSRDVDGEAERADGKQPGKGVWILPVKCRRTDRERGIKRVM